MQILVVNAGSSSMKFGLYDFDSLELIARGLLDWVGESHRASITITSNNGHRSEKQLDVPDYRHAAVEALRLLGQNGFASEDLSSIRVVGHRLIHGGDIRYISCDPFRGLGISFSSGRRGCQLHNG